jgi:acyl-CoA dehydrogenase
MFKAQGALEGVISNFPNRLIAAIVRLVVFPLGRPYVEPSDRLGHEVARLLIAPSATRDRLTTPMFVATAEDDPIAQIERALAATVATEPIEAKLKAAAKAGTLSLALAPGEDVGALAARAAAAGVIDAAEARTLVEQRALVAKVIRVDDFAPDLGTSLLDVLAPGEPASATASPVPARVHKAAA